MTLLAADEPWRRDAADVVVDQGSDPLQGLTAAEVLQRREQFGPNLIDATEAVPAWRKFFDQFADPLIYLLLGAVVVSFAAWVLEGRQGVPYEVLVIVAVVTLNAVLGYVQQERAEHAVAALQRMAATSAGVIRDGRSGRIAAHELVPGDIVVIGEGDAISADARLVETASLTVAEASLTGESESVLKDVATLSHPVGVGDRVNMIFSGTAVTRGHGRAVVTATGMSTEMGRVATLLGQTASRPTPLQVEVDHIGRLLGLAVGVITLVVTTAILITTDIDGVSDLIEVLLVGVSLAVAAVPEGLPAVLSVVLGLGVQRMARRQAIVKKLSSVETLGSASVVCTDKTGTLTKNEMTIEKVVTASGAVDVTGIGYAPVGDFCVGGAPLEDEMLVEEVRMVLGGGSLANNAVLGQENGQWTIQGDPTEAAFLVAEAKLGTSAERAARFERVGEIPFTSERKLMSTLHTDADRDGRIALVTKGAPEVLLARCTHDRAGGQIRPLTEQRKTEILGCVEALAESALRTLAVAYRPLEDLQPPEPHEGIEHNLVYLGMVGIIDPPRPEAKLAIGEAKAAGIRVIMITGDHPRTAARIAADLGVIERDGEAMTGADLVALDDDALVLAARTTAVYARVSPEQKLRIIKAFQTDHNIVAMTGDGVNDAPAMKLADIGVAMGITGTDVAKEASDMILADDNFATIIAAVREGRGIFANIRKFLRFLLSSNIGEVFTMLFGVLLAPLLGLDVSGNSLAVPLLATQILWINLLTDTAPALALAFDPPPEGVMSRPPRRLTDRVIDREMWFGSVWSGFVMSVVTLIALDLHLAGGIFAGSGEIGPARTMALTTLVFAQLFNAVNARSDRVSAFHNLAANRYLWAAIALSVTLQVAVVHTRFLNAAFETTPLSGRDWLICLGLASAVLWADEAKKIVVRKWLRSR